jgi:hypothetical protein
MDPQSLILLAEYASVIVAVIVAACAIVELSAGRGWRCLLLLGIAGVWVCANAIGFVFVWMGTCFMPACVSPDLPTKAAVGVSVHGIICIAIVLGVARSVIHAAQEFPGAPKEIEGGRVLLYGHVSTTPVVSRYASPRPSVKPNWIAGLMVCQYPGTVGVMLFHCDVRWNICRLEVMRDIVHAKESSEIQYPACNILWRSHG